MDESSDDNDEDDDSDGYISINERNGQVKVNTVHSPIEPKSPPPQHSDLINKIDPEPPPPLPPEILPTTDEIQWIKDVMYSAQQDMARVRLLNDAIVEGITYTPFVRKLKGSIRLNNYILYLQQITARKPHMPPLRTSPMHIPTPKSHPTINSTRDILHDTTWKDYDCKNWVKNTT